MTTTHHFRVVLAPSEAEAGRHAGEAAARAIDAAIESHGKARVILASAPSQSAMLATLAASDVDWSKVEAFHMDEYIGIDPTDARAFGQWLADRLPTDQMARFERIDPAAEPAEEAKRYDALLREEPIDVTLMGFGMNGHIAFNEPGADLNPAEYAQPVELTRESREQQVIDECFASIDECPTHAVSLTVSALLSAGTVISTVVGDHKAQAVADALEGPLTNACPASILRFHPNAILALDAAASAKLTATPMRQA